MILASRTLYQEQTHFYLKLISFLNNPPKATLKKKFKTPTPTKAYVPFRV